MSQLSGWFIVAVVLHSLLKILTIIMRTTRRRHGRDRSWRKMVWKISIERTRRRRDE